MIEMERDEALNTKREIIQQVINGIFCVHKDVVLWGRVMT